MLRDQWPVYNLLFLQCCDGFEKNDTLGVNAGGMVVVCASNVFPILCPPGEQCNDEILKHSVFNRVFP